MVDEALILRKLADLSTYIQQISDFRSLSVDEYKSDWKTQRVVDRTLHRLKRSNTLLTEY